jgi:hypothetical protein
MKTIYRVEYRDPRSGGWTTEGIETRPGDADFTTEAEAWDAIDALRNCGPDFAAVKYRVREIER